MSQQPANITGPSGDEPLSTVHRAGVEYTILGTAHVSRASAEAVTRLIESGDYDAVAIELCPARHAVLSGDRSWRDIDLFQIIKQKKAGLLLANLALSGYQRRIAEQFGIEPGAEMKAAIDAAEQAGLPVQLIDRDVGITLKRLYGSVGLWGRMKLITGLAASAFSGESVSEEEIEKLKQGDMLDATFTEFAESSPQMYAPLIDERDRFMAARLREDNAEPHHAADGAEDAEDHTRVLVVIGAGHLSGLSRYLKDDDAPAAAVQQDLSTIPPARPWLKLLPWLIVALVLTGFWLGFQRSPELGWRLIGFWVLINGTLAALGAAIARAHPLTILSGFLAAPLTSLNPTIAAGMVTGLVEAALRKPTVANLEDLRKDVTRLKGWYGNPATRVLLVFFFSNLGSMLGTWIAGFKIIESLV